MPNASILARLGPFVQRDFLSAELCRLVQSEMAPADRVAAMIRPVGDAGEGQASSCARLLVRRDASGPATERGVLSAFRAGADRFSWGTETGRGLLFGGAEDRDLARGRRRVP